MWRVICLLALVLLAGLQALAQANSQFDIFGGYSYLHVSPGRTPRSEHQRLGGPGYGQPECVHWGDCRL